ncbi:MAG: sigma-70 family RNA polymerase sigma factor [Pirellulaceae bacterium]
MTDQPPDQDDFRDSQDLSPQDAEFQQWIDSAREGSIDAVAELMRASREYLLLIANHELDNDLRRKLGPSDVVQSSIMDATRCIEQFQGSSRQQFMAWLRTILHNRVARKRRDYKSSEKRNIRREQPLQSARQSGQHALQIAVDEPTPATEAAKNEQLALVAGCLAELPEDYQRVIRMRQWEQLTFREIATRMNRTEDACQKLWRRAIAALKHSLAGKHVL